MNSSTTCSDQSDTAEDIDSHMDGYSRYEFERYGFDSGCTVSSMAIYVEEGRTVSES
ncbi:hypothetical protein ACFFQF_10350 [Haladaptatus pallidirubidus]